MRACGGCTECCKLPPVAEVGKALHAPCNHLVLLGKKARKAGAQGGCSIHATRPQVCRGFDCGWITVPAAFPDDAQRPDSLGVIFSPLPLEDGTTAYWAWEARRGALARAAPLLATLRILVAIGYDATAEQWAEAEWIGIIKGLGAEKARILWNARGLDPRHLELLLDRVAVR
jgi:hypothetical protein